MDRDILTVDGGHVAVDQIKWCFRLRGYDPGDKMADISVGSHDDRWVVVWGSIWGPDGDPVPLGDTPDDFVTSGVRWSRSVEYAMLDTIDVIDRCISDDALRRIAVALLDEWKGDVEDAFTPRPEGEPRREIPVVDEDVRDVLRRWGDPAEESFRRFEKSFPASDFEAGVRELAEVSFSAGQALEIRTRLDGSIVEESVPSEAEAVRRLATNVAGDRPTGNGVGWDSCAVRISAYGVDYTTRSGLRFGWYLDFFSGGFSSWRYGRRVFYVAHPRANWRRAAPAESTLRASAEGRGWVERRERMTCGVRPIAD